MGDKLSVEECTSTENQHVRECCHLEGETPIEIRIAYQQPKQPQRLQNFSHAGGSLHPGGGAGVAAGVMRAPAVGSTMNGSSLTPRPYGAPALAGDALLAVGDRAGQPFGGRPWPQGASGDANRPPMPRGADKLRLPPPGSSSAHKADGDEFDPDTFAAPPDSERGENAALAQQRLQQALALKVLQMQQEDDYFPEIVRVSNGCRDGGLRAQQNGSKPRPPGLHKKGAEFGCTNGHTPLPSARKESASERNSQFDPATPTRL